MIRRLAKSCQFPNTQICSALFALSLGQATQAAVLWECYSRWKSEYGKAPADLPFIMNQDTRLCRINPSQTDRRWEPYKLVAPVVAIMNPDGFIFIDGLKEATKIETWFWWQASRLRSSNVLRVSASYSLGEVLVMWYCIPIDKAGKAFTSVGVAPTISWGSWQY